jgi:hypothetical protein
LAEALEDGSDFGEAGANGVDLREEQLDFRDDAHLFGQVRIPGQGGRDSGMNPVSIPK